MLVSGRAFIMSIALLTITSILHINLPQLDKNLNLFIFILLPISSLSTCFHPKKRKKERKKEKKKERKKHTSTWATFPLYNSCQPEIVHCTLEGGQLFPYHGSEGGVSNNGVVGHPSTNSLTPSTWRGSPPTQ